MQDISTALNQFLKTRGIDPVIAAQCGVRAGLIDFPDHGTQPALITVTETADGTVIGRQARMLEQKVFKQAVGSKVGLWNLKRCVNADTLYITEGALDALALMTCGYPMEQVVALPATGKAEEAVRDAIAQGCNPSRVYIAGDMDEPGQAAREKLANAWGPGRCFSVEWQRKDCNEVLVKDGPGEVEEAIETARPWPIAGLSLFSDLPEAQDIPVWTVFDEWAGKFHLAPGMLTLVVGQPGQGKSHLTLQMVYQLCARYDMRAAVASFETRLKPYVLRRLRSFRYKKLEKDMKLDEIGEADEWIDEHIIPIFHPDRKPDIDWLLGVAESAVERYGIKILLVDPWNKLEMNAAVDRVDTTYIARCLDALMLFAQTYNVLVLLIAHPAKMGQRAGQAPLLEDVSSSKHFDNAVDQGIVIHGDALFSDMGVPLYERDVLIRKSRYEELGRPTRMRVRLNPATDCYEVD